MLDGRCWRVRRPEERDWLFGWLCACRGQTDNGVNYRYFIGREAAIPGMPVDRFGAIGLMDAVDTVAGDIARVPCIRRFKVGDDRVGRRRDLLELLGSQSKSSAMLAVPR